VTKKSPGGPQDQRDESGYDQANCSSPRVQRTHATAGLPPAHAPEKGVQNEYASTTGLIKHPLGSQRPGTPRARALVYGLSPARGAWSKTDSADAPPLNRPKTPARPGPRVGPTRNRSTKPLSNAVSYSRILQNSHAEPRGAVCSLYSGSGGVSKRRVEAPTDGPLYSTVTLLARLRGLSTFRPRALATW
jgi:hypothetical protein